MKIGPSNRAQNIKENHWDKFLPSSFYSFSYSKLSFGVKTSLKEKRIKLKYIIYIRFGIHMTNIYPEFMNIYIYILFY